MSSNWKKRNRPNPPGTKPRRRAEASELKHIWEGLAPEETPLVRAFVGRATQGQKHKLAWCVGREQVMKMVRSAMTAMKLRASSAPGIQQSPKKSHTWKDATRWKGMIAKKPKKPFIWRDVVLKPGSKRFKGLPLMDPSQRSGKCRILVKDGVAVAQED